MLGNELAGAEGVDGAQPILQLELITEHTSDANLLAGADYAQAVFLNLSQALVKAGRITEKEALAKASNPQALEMNFKGIFLDEGRRIIS